MVIQKRQTETEYEKYVLISDLHGRYEHLKRVYDRYNSLFSGNVGFVHAGDAIDSLYPHNNSKKTIQTLLDIGAVCLYGNHEWVEQVIVNQTNDDIKSFMINQVWKHHQRRLYTSYGIDNPTNEEEQIKAFDRLQDEIKSVGHDKYFTELKTYFEPSGLGFIAVHAGLYTDQNWYGIGGQREYLESVTATNDDYEPPQICSFELANLKVRIPDDISDKTLISGHDHYPYKRTEVTDNFGRFVSGRVSLGSDPNPDGPIYAWESWSNKIVEIYK